MDSTAKRCIRVTASASNVMLGRLAGLFPVLNVFNQKPVWVKHPHVSTGWHRPGQRNNIRADTFEMSPKCIKIVHYKSRMR